MDPFGVDPSGCWARSNTPKRGHRTAALLFFAVALTTASLLLLCPTPAHAQGGVPLWTNRYDGGSSDYPNAITVDRNGNVFVTGNTATIKYSGLGIPLWTNFPGGGAIVVDSSNNVFVSNVPIAGNTATIKYLGLGVPLWTNFAGGNAIAVDSGGNVFVTGNSWNGSDYDIATIKYSTAGIPLWTNYNDGSSGLSDLARSIAVDSGGNVIVAGITSVSTSPADYNYVTIKYSTGGDLLWINYYGGPDDASGNSRDEPWSIAVDSTDNVFVAGISGAANGYTDYATVAYSSAGVPLWTNRYNGPANSEDDAVAVAVDSSGNVFVTGPSYSGSQLVFSDYATIKYSSAGVPLWTRRYNGPANNNDNARAIAVDSAGNVFVTGESYGADGNSTDYATVAYSNSGVVLWTNRYNRLGNGYDSATAIALDRNGNVFVTGYSWNGTNYDWVTIKYSSSIPLPRLDFQKLNNELVLSWTNAGFHLQTAPAVTGPFTNLPAASSPHTNPLTTPQQFFRLISN